MRVCFTAHPNPGHFHPLVPTARALQAAGHAVCFACPETYRETVVASGFQFVPVGLGFEQMHDAHPEIGERLDAIRAPAASAPATLRGLFAAIFIDILARRTARDLLAHAQVQQPDLIVRGAMEFGGCVAAEVLGIPHATLGVGLFAPIERQRRSLAPALDALRAAFGLPADPNLEMLYRQLYLSFVPPSLQADYGRLPPSARSLSPEIFDRSGTESLPAWVARRGARPLIYVTMGTVATRFTNHFAPILEALRDEPVDVVVTVGRSQDPAALGPQPPHVHVERYIPQTLIFPHCDLAIMHGGFNSMQSALMHGLPMLFIPVMADQPVNAAICTRLGAGQTLARQDLSPDRIRRAVRELLEKPSYRARASRLQREMQALPKLDTCVALFEALAAPQRSARAAV